LQFKQLTVDDIGALRPYFRENVPQICDGTIGTTFMWRDMAHTEFAVDGGVLYLKAHYEHGRTSFAPPRGAANFADAVSHIAEHCRENALPLRFCPVVEPELTLLRELYPTANVYADDAWSDYLYNASDLRDFAGRRFQGQRNHCNRFAANYPDWRFAAIDETNRADARAFLESYMRDHPKQDFEAYDEGNLKALEVLDNFDEYTQVCGALYVDGAVVGVALGEIVGDTLYIHNEKALTDYAGAYPMLVREFARAFAVDPVAFVNREEDDGVEGLRISKASYHPIRLIEKYCVEVLVADS
jgi:hypothetical protein